MSTPGTVEVNCNRTAVLLAEREEREVPAASRRGRRGRGRGGTSRRARRGRSARRAGAPEPRAPPPPPPPCRAGGRTEAAAAAGALPPRPYGTVLVNWPVSLRWPSPRAEEEEVETVAGAGGVGGGARVGSRWDCKPPRGGLLRRRFIGGERGAIFFGTPHHYPCMDLDASCWITWIIIYLRH
jgi:hypothetical protein